MKTLNLIISVCLTLLIFSPIVKADKIKLKYGKITPEEIEMKSCAIDSSANAVVLGAIGDISFRISNNDIVTVFNKYIRVKIFNKEGFDEGNFRIHLFKNNSSKEKTTSIKGTVYNMVDGKLEKTRLNNDNIFRDELDKNHDIVKVTMPDIKEGSIIDFEYSIESPFFYNLNPWYFQSGIPTLYSEYTANIIEWYHYKNWMEGYHTINKTETTNTEKFMFRVEAKIDHQGRTPGQTVDFDAEVTHMKYTAENVPAFKNEPRITTPQDYLSSIQFELQSTKYPWDVYKPYTKDWESVNKTLLEDENFGYTLKNDGHLKDIAESLTLKSSSANQIACAAYYHIKKNMVWNGKYRSQATTTIKKAYNDNEGSSADLNLNLVALCKKAGLDAYPVLVSTRDHGMVRPGLVSLTQFNHVITAISTEGGYLLMDATGSNCPYNLLPASCLNGQGRLVREGLGDWVDLYSNTPKDDVYVLNLELKDDLSLEGSMTYKASNYGAIQFRKYYKSKGNEDDFVADYESSLKDAEITDLTIEDLDSLQNPVVLKSHITLKNRVGSAGNMVYLNPKVINQIVENEFKREERTYPVDYNYPIKTQYIVRIVLPEGYTIEELPEKMVLNLNNNGAKYVFMTMAQGNVIQFTNQYLINQTIFPGIEYPDLKKFNEMIVTKEAEQIVIKKMN